MVEQFPVIASRRVVQRSLVCLVFALAFCVSGCGIFPQKERVLVTVEIEVNGRIVKGQAVQEYTCREPWKIMSNMDVGTCNSKGEAVVVDLGNKRLFVVLLRGWPGRTPIRSGKSVLFGKRAIPTTSLPIMVTFADPNRRETAKTFRPENVTEVFGKGVRIKAIYAQFTGKPVTTENIEAFLPWLKDGTTTTYLTKSGTSSDPINGSSLQYSDFIGGGND